jgi:hypothetical protein
MSKLISGSRNCPKCGNTWDGELILDTFLQMKADGNNFYRDKSDEEIRKSVVENYGSVDRKWGREIGIEILGGYDGIAQWLCPDCNTKFDRWTGEEIKPEES